METGGSQDYMIRMGILQVLKTQFLCHLIICYVFLVSGIIINLVQLCTLPLWPINKQLARKINCRLGYSISSRKSCKLSHVSSHLPNKDTDTSTMMQQVSSAYFVCTKSKDCMMSQNHITIVTN